MTKRTRKFIGAIVIVVYAIFYIMIATGLADSRISQEGFLIKAIFYVVVGIAWIVPLMPLIRWMERPDRDKA